MFDALPETRGNGKTLKSRFVSTAAVAHAALFGVIVGSSFLARIDAGEDPPKPYEIYHVTTMELPRGDNMAAGGGGPRKAPEPPKPEPREPDPAPVQPRELEVLPQTPPAPESPTTASTPVEPTGEPGIGTGGGKGGGNGTGTGEGDGSGTGPGVQGDPEGRGTEMPVDDVIVISGELKHPVLIRRVEPEYPEVARRAHKEGDVILEAIVGTDGRVESVRVLRSEPLLDRAATRAVAQWIYSPSIYRGRPVKVYVTIYVQFRLN